MLKCNIKRGRLKIPTSFVSCVSQNVCIRPKYIYLHFYVDANIVVCTPIVPKVALNVLKSHIKQRRLKIPIPNIVFPVLTWLWPAVLQNVLEGCSKMD